MRIPRSTYRLQINGDFPLEKVEEIIDYLHLLGISHIYASPILKSKHGSKHGYDMTDFSTLNPEVGDTGLLREISESLRSHGMGWIQDFAPNHMLYGPDNPYMLEVMKSGSKSPYSRFFDILWDRPEDPHPGKLCAPFLGEPLENAIENGNIELVTDKDAGIVYYDTRFPLSAESMAILSGIELKDRKVVLKKVLDSQHYNLEYWKNSMEEINYRRFFSINELIGVREEDREVFGKVHEFILSLVEEGIIDGLRIDHIDGLLEPGNYLGNLKAETDAYTVVEKILEYPETLPEEWPCQGTTGYDFLNIVNSVFTMEDSEEKFSRLYSDITGVGWDYSSQLISTKREKLEGEFAGDLDNVAVEIAGSLGDLTESDYEKVRELIKEIIVHLDVYRTYLGDENSKNNTNLQYMLSSLKESRKGLNAGRIADMIEGRIRSGTDLVKSFGRLQQLCSPIMAKSGEDTMFFRYNRLISLNEVGCNPSIFGLPLQEFHQFMADRSGRWRHSMNASSTHDTKMGEDARVRVSVLSQIPDRWFSTVQKWMKLNEPHRSLISEEAVPDRNEEYYIYQILMATIPYEQGVGEALRKRVSAHMVKAMREAGIHTSWTSVNEEYESGVTNFIQRIMDKDSAHEFVTSLFALHNSVSHHGALESLSQLILKMTCPGVPDFYQGSETWNLSLTDPDNRRDVDFRGLNEMMLRIVDPESGGSSPLSLLENYHSGEVKQFITRSTLKLREAESELFLEGGYRSLEATGVHSGSLIGFMRELEGSAIITLVPRFTTLLSEHGKTPMGNDVWKDTAISVPEFMGTMKNIFTGERIEVKGGRILIGDILKTFPYAVLCKCDGRGDNDER